MAVLKTRDFRVHHQGFNLTVYGEVPAGAGTVEVRLLHALDLNFADGVGHPFSGLRLRGLEEYLGGRLREHDLGEVSVDDLQLRFALKSKNERVLGFPIFSDGGVELRQPLQAGKLVQNEPYRSLIVLRRG